MRTKQIKTGMTCYSTGSHPTFFYLVRGKFLASMLVSSGHKRIYIKGHVVCVWAYFLILSNNVKL